MDTGQEEGAAPTRIRKYANRRLYDTGTSTFVTLSDLAAMVKAGKEFEVEDATTGADLTSAVLIQIIAEEEAKGEHLLPHGYLRRLIGFYGEDTSRYLTTYLEQTLEAFVRNQHQFVSGMQELLAAEAPWQAIARQNMTLFRRTLESFAGMSGAERTGPAAEETPRQAPAPEDPRSDEIAELKQAIEALQKKVEELG